LFVGIGAYYFKYKDEVLTQKQFDYSQQDSLFWNNLSGEQKTNFAKKKVDYEQELYDFSDNELESVLTTVNINTASIEELITLPGIGEKKLDKIKKYILIE
jgi:DNA uptake protein ComE-like DNA-binding protein